MARYYLNPAADGLTYTSKDGVLVHALPGTFFDTATTPLPSNWTVPPDCWSIWPCDVAAQSALQASCDAKKAAMGGVSVCPGLPGGFPDSIPIFNP
jgi:hypothetical protein